ncbi:putative disease resistance protein At3g14460 [Vigna radiata var. radiata]|uniref:Disease resistance protein At3g14460 n=1 Tax=Vigna radiata var. radiata TaxID=3916 RepID=A0A3Q0F316_VIGRR|nr:putative disease resistance protein At3g14460 [Vigna radiata var. radiata]
MSINDLFSKFKFIRVLSLSYCNRLTEVPESIGNLKHIRLLNLSHTNIEKLPDSLSLLYKLQILKLNCCQKLKELPSYLHQLDNLCRLEFVHTRVKNVPTHLGKRKALQVLMSSFCVKKSKEFGIQQLGELDLHGSLTIDELQNIENPSDALEADLKNKSHLMGLELTWKLIVGSHVDSTKVGNVIENLRPSKCLKKLSVINYVGKQFPNWLLNNSLPNLVYLVLLNCKNCQRFPRLGLLPFLMKLVISRCDEIVNIDADFHGNNSCSFKSLETLEFSFMMQWEKWECKAVTGAFPRLQHLSMHYCPKLKGHLPEKLVPLKTLKITSCQQLEASTPRTIALEVNHCGKLQLEWATMKRLRMGCHSTEASLLENITSDISLQHMHIYSSLTSISVNSVSLRTFPLDFLTKLRTLSITEFPNLQTISQDHVHNHLQDLAITNCPKFESFPTNMHTLLPSLTKLHIADCPRLESFPKGGLPSNLKCMSLNNCSRLVGSLKGAFGANALLEMLSIEEVDAECFPEEGLLPLSVTSLTIDHCLNLKEIDYKGLYQLSSLQTLRLLNCPNFQRLPDEGLPKSISSLEIANCPLLKQRCMEGRR